MHKFGYRQNTGTRTCNEPLNQKNCRTCSFAALLLPLTAALHARCRATPCSLAQRLSTTWGPAPGDRPAKVLSVRLAEDGRGAVKPASHQAFTAFIVFYSGSHRGLHHVLFP